MKSIVVPAVLAASLLLVGQSAQALSTKVELDKYRSGAVSGKVEFIIPAPDEGWVYLGDAYERRTFNWAGWLPQPGDVISASTDVNLRPDHKRFDRRIGDWRNAKKIGLIHQGDLVQVVELARFCWAQIIRAD